jgi:hypothetical protein
MTIHIAPPPNSDLVQALIEQRLADVEGKPGETVTVELRDQPHHLPVITVPISALYYNPLTNRVGAQRDYFRTYDQQIADDPWSDTSQLILATMLKALPSDPHRDDPAYERLRNDLREHGQTEPGIVTRDGVLVNGNTRRAALADLQGQQANMRVAVLPLSAGWADVADIELALQMRHDHKREYSWVNRLIAIARLAADGVPSGVIAAKFRSTAKVVETEVGIYYRLMSLIHRSHVGNDKLPLIAFEDKAERLRELAAFTKKVAARDPGAADVVREVRLAAIMLNFSKTEVRYIEADFFDRHLADRLPPELRAQGPGEKTPIPGLGVSVDGPPEAVVSAANLADAVLRALVDRDALHGREELHALMAGALEHARRASWARKKVSATPDRLRNAATVLNEAIGDVGQALATSSFDATEVDAALGDVRTSLRQLARQLARTPDHGANVEWLLGLAREET